MSLPVPQPMDFSLLKAGRLGRTLVQIGIPESRAERIIQFGAVYCNGERLWKDKKLRTGDCLRVHPDPRRFPVGRWDWSSRIVYKNSDYVVVNKPPEIPVHPTCDNGEENLVAQFSRLLKAKCRLVQRLDIGTQGLMVLGLDSGFLKGFYDQLFQHKVVKRYRALIESPVSLGRLTQFMMDEERPPRRLFEEEQSGSLRCELQIDSVEPFGEFYEVTMQAITGRNHQIRAQLAHQGCPIVGDQLYGSTQEVPWESVSDDAFCLQAFSTQFSYQGRQVKYEIERPW